jgi:hypothetical protein
MKYERKIKKILSGKAGGKDKVHPTQAAKGLEGE